MITTWTNTEKFMAQRIIATPSKYTPTITARPDLKIGIDNYLISIDMGNLIVE